MERLAIYLIRSTEAEKDRRQQPAVRDKGLGGRSPHTHHSMRNHSWAITRDALTKFRRSIQRRRFGLAWRHLRVGFAFLREAML